MKTTWIPLISMHDHSMVPPRNDACVQTRPGGSRAANRSRRGRGGLQTWWLVVLGGLLTGTIHGQTYSLVRSFGLADRMGNAPEAGLALGPDGRLYGTAYGGGGGSCWMGCGVVFRVNRDGSGYQALHQFGTGSGDGTYPWAGVIVARNGALYGTTESGGNADLGTVYTLQPDGSGYAVLHHFGTGEGDGRYPEAALLEGPDGMLYGTTSSGGQTGKGTVFHVGQDGSGYGILHSFSGLGGDGADPYAALIQGGDGALYGTTSQGGQDGVGTVFTLLPDGGGYAVRHQFRAADNDGRYPDTPLTQGRDGRLYGTTSQGGDKGVGTVFVMDRDGGNYSILHHFDDEGGDGYGPAALLQGRNNHWYGVAHSGGSGNAGVLFEMNADGGDYSVLVNFTRTGGPQWPAGGLIQDSDGGLYGPSEAGGTSGDGTLYRVDEDGTNLRVLWEFTPTGNDGYSPYGALSEGSSDRLYGTTFEGGTKDLGTVFRMNRDGSDYEVIRSFGETPADGLHPMSAPVESAEGWVYGATTMGGVTNPTYRDGQGVLFRLKPDGSDFTVIRRFSGPDGREPEAGPITSRDGRLYGATQAGGSLNRGVLYRFTGDGADYEVLHEFGSISADGTSPREVIEAGDGAIYGTTHTGGTGGSGIIYRYKPAEKEFTILHHFGSTSNDGAHPYAGLEQGSDGALYGATSHGGASNAGALFSIGRDGASYAILHSFTTQANDLNTPDAHPVEGPDQKLYGPARGGSAGKGALYRVDKDGQNFAVIHHFGAETGDGQSCWMPLLKAGDGKLYGVTEGGGQFRLGTVFVYDTGGTPGTPARFTAWTAAGGGVSTIEALGQAATRYRLERTDALATGAWFEVQAAVAGPDGKLLYTNLPTEGLQRFYRLVTP